VGIIVLRGGTQGQARNLKRGGSYMDWFNCKTEPGGRLGSVFPLLAFSLFPLSGFPAVKAKYHQLPQSKPKHAQDRMGVVR